MQMIFYCYNEITGYWFGMVDGTVLASFVKLNPHETGKLRSPHNV